VFLAAISQIELRGLVAEEELAQIKMGVQFPHQVTVSVCIRMALDIEELQ
jgi:hypothetical protein